jgi:hypothetical protein
VAGSGLSSRCLNRDAKDRERDLQGAGLMNLQATLSSASTMSNDGTTVVQPHHPITCRGELRLDAGVLAG